MPRLLYLNENSGCGATILLDSGDACLISVAQSGVLVRSYRHSFFGGLFGSFFGPTLYHEKNVYNVARTAQALSTTFPEVPDLRCENLVLRAFGNAIWHCASPARIAITLNEIGR